jgi:hypothetical protein
LGLKIYPKKFSAEMEFREIGSCWSRWSANDGADSATAAWNKFLISGSKLVYTVRHFLSAPAHHDAVWHDTNAARHDTTLRCHQAY